MKRTRLLKTVYLLPPVLLAVSLVCLYGPVLIGLWLPEALNGLQLLLVRVLFVALRVVFPLCGIAGVVLNLGRLRSCPGRSAGLILLGLAYLAIGVWLILLGIVFHT